MQFRASEGRQAFRRVGMDAGRHEGRAFREGRERLERAGAVREEETSALQAAGAQREAMFEVAMIVLVRLRVDDDGSAHARAVHAAEQLFGSRQRGGPVGGVLVVGEARIGGPREAMDMRIHGAVVLRRRGSRSRAAGERADEGRFQDVAPGGA